MADLSQFSTADLEAMSQGKLSSVSDQGLQMLHDTATQAAPQDSAQPSLFHQVVKNTIDDLPMLGGVVGGILGTPADAVSGPMGNIVGAGIGGYLGTATKNLINHYYDPASAPKTTTQALTQPVLGGVEQGLMQGTGEAVAPYVAKGLQVAAGAAKDAVKWGATRVLSNAGSVSPKVINEYAQFSDRIASAPSEEALKNISDEFVGKLASDVDAKEITAEQAQKALDTHLSDLKDAYKTARYDAMDALTSAQQTLKDAHNSRLQQVSGDVYDTVNQLKSDVKAGSGKALDVLDQSDKMIKLTPVYEELNSQIESAQKAGTKEGSALAQELTDYRDNLAKAADYSGKLNPVDAKQRIQGLDNITSYNPMAGSFDKMKNAAYKGVRAAFDQSVKSTVPEYAAAMKPVAADADLLDRVQGFGDKQQAVGLLQRINAPNQLENRAALRQLGQKYGIDYVNAVQPESLPEQQLVTQAQGKLDALRPDRVAEKIDQTVSGSRQKAALDQAQSEYQAAQEKLAPYKSLAPNSDGQTQAQQKLAQLGKGKNIELTKMFQNLGKLSNTDFVQAMKDNEVKATFQKGATNGSRNTLIGALVGGLFGLLSGGEGLGTMTGLTFGGGMGRAVDQWGPVVTKKILDGAIQVARNPAVSTIANLEIPDAAKRTMVVGLENYLARGRQVVQDSASRVAGYDQTQSHAPAQGQAQNPSAWAQQGIEKLGIQDQDLASRLMQDPQGQELLHKASDLTPGSKAMKGIMDQIQKGFGKKK